MPSEDYDTRYHLAHEIVWADKRRLRIQRPSGITQAVARCLKNLGPEDQPEKIAKQSADAIYMYLLGG